MGYRDINDVWQDAFNSRSTQYRIIGVLLADASSCVYLLENNCEMRISVDTRLYHFSKSLMSEGYKHVAKVYDCFKTILPNQYGEEENVFCIVTERLYRDYPSREIIQNAINLFRNTWSEYLKSIQRLRHNTDVCIEQAYVDKDLVGEKKVLDKIRNAESNPIIIDIALVLHDVYKAIKRLDSNSMLFLFPDNLGLSEDGIFKMCNISHNFFGLDDNYEVESESNSISIIYNPIICEDAVKDYRMLIPLKVDFGDGIICPVLGQIDTGATTSGFAESFFYRASLANLGETEVTGVSGSIKSKLTECLVEFPNGYKATLNGSTMKDIGDVSILIGMDLLCMCKFQFEPYKNGFKYKLFFYKP